MLGHCIRQRRETALVGRQLYRAMRQGSEEAIDNLDELMTEGEADGFVEVERKFRVSHFRHQVASGMSSFAGRSSGKRITSRMERESVSNMVRRSMPMPSPPAGGIP